MPVGPGPILGRPSEQTSHVGREKSGINFKKAHIESVYRSLRRSLRIFDYDIQFDSRTDIINLIERALKNLSNLRNMYEKAGVEGKDH